MLQVLRPIQSRDPSLDRPLGRVGVVSLAVCIVLLVGIGTASVWAAWRSGVVLDKAQQFRDKRALISSMLLQVEGAETSQRGYLLTLNANYLAGLQGATAAMPGMLGQLDQDWRGEARIVVLRQAMTAKLAELSRTAELAQNGDLPGALSIVRTDIGRQNMIILRRMVGTLQTELDMNLAGEVRTADRDNRVAVAVAVAGLVMVALLAGQILFAVRRYLASLALARDAAAKAYAALEQNNERLDDIVRARTADLVAANDEIQRFAYIVSHDLRAPLVNIMGFTSEMEQASAVVAAHAATESASQKLRQAAAEDIPEALRFIRSSTAKMDRLINAILKLSREGRRVLAPEPIDMAGLFAGLTETMQHQVGSKDAEIVVEAMPDLIADRLAVEQVFGNLIDNALKYLTPGVPGRIVVTGERRGSMVRYEISDNGRGIAPRDYERVFELFRRAGDQSVPGEGIGLAHVRALVRRLGGSIDCASTLGKGTVFTVRLPAAQSLVGDRQSGDNPPHLGHSRAGAAA